MTSSISDSGHDIVSTVSGEPVIEGTTTEGTTKCVEMARSHAKSPKTREQMAVWMSDGFNANDTHLSNKSILPERYDETSNYLEMDRPPGTVTSLELTLLMRVLLQVLQPFNQLVTLP